MKGDCTVGTRLLGERARWFALAIAASAAFVATMAAQPARADFTSARCTGSNVVGRGASFANTAHAGWISYFSSTWCPGGPSVTYEPQEAAPVAASWASGPVPTRPAR